MKNIIMLPTGKEYLSYSELKTWLDCAWQHKLIHVDKIDESKETIYTVFGTILHDALENYLRTRTMDVHAASLNLREAWTAKNYPNADWPNFKSAVKELDYWDMSLKSILANVPKYLEDNFPNWEFVDAEHYLFEPIEGLNVSFKGYIDGVIKYKNSKGKYVYFILDWKTTSHVGWHKEKVRDYKTHLQLMLYKHFLSKKLNLKTTDVKCGFILLKKLDVNPKNRSKIPKIGMVPVSLGPKTTEKSLKNIRMMVKNLKMNRYLKNRTNCQFCQFKETDHCRLT